MSALTLDQLPEVVLICIMQYCSAEDLASLRSTCKRICSLAGYDGLWKNLCIRGKVYSPLTSIVMAQ